MTVIYHLTEPATWAAAVAAGQYTMSTREVTLAEEGYIHASLPHQVRGVADRFYADVPELLLLVIDTDKLGAEVKLEQAGAELFPHIYGPIPVAAVSEVVEVAPDRSNLPG
ncbi:hypothetical protein Lfu02_44560 [Longispora fulva]|uniref:Uncharacterized protein (DUF952 family) n=1 Tax=Longispora fulva TaxID=619741 RepID=A0A8J7GFE4_9ACTN|nr:DUF952 domain-containing protein [Longispora fulva]MBG6137829.1 uncharacterized protein (DUF952 family) [Longispora fulva]GIG60084.1 hypothetical protein Lfu02_44560 [Longispora fulva]